ncbi:hypothetical protein C8R45DRAFT_931989 [Mycena sanguinolenta]|nr:hypothetical protein C8R45DRAFT_931989 [Mycena sanguinolenta]
MDSNPIDLSDDDDTIGALSYLLMQLNQHSYGRQFKYRNRNYAALGTLRFAHLPSNSFLFLLPQGGQLPKPRDFCRTCYREGSLKEPLAKAMASLNTVRGKRKVNVNILEMEEEEEEEEMDGGQMQSSDKISTARPLDTEFGQNFGDRPFGKFGQNFLNGQIWYPTYYPIIQDPPTTRSRQRRLYLTALAPLVVRILITRISRPHAASLNPHARRSIVDSGRKWARLCAFPVRVHVLRHPPLSSTSASNGTFSRHGQWPLATTSPVFPLRVYDDAAPRGILTSFTGRLENSVCPLAAASYSVYSNGQCARVHATSGALPLEVDAQTLAIGTCTFESSKSRLQSFILALSQFITSTGFDVTYNSSAAFDSLSSRSRYDADFCKLRITSICFMLRSTGIQTANLCRAELSIVACDLTRRTRGIQFDPPSVDEQLLHIFISSKDTRNSFRSSSPNSGEYVHAASTQTTDLKREYHLFLTSTGLLFEGLVLGAGGTGADFASLVTILQILSIICLLARDEEHHLDPAVEAALLLGGIARAPTSAARQLCDSTMTHVGAALKGLFTALTDSAYFFTKMIFSPMLLIQIRLRSLVRFHFRFSSHLRVLFGAL